MNVYIVYGSPASGKTTYVKKNKTEDDLIVDFDYIKQAITLNDKSSDAKKLHKVAEKIREYIYGLIDNKEIDCENVWIVAGLPNADERISLANRFNAQLIFIDTPKQLCIERAMKDDSRKDKELQIQIINKWFEKYMEKPITNEIW